MNTVLIAILVVGSIGLIVGVFLSLASEKFHVQVNENEEKIRTGIKNLKVGYTKVFGYYIEVTKSFLKQVPTDRYIRKQTLTNGERFITEELKKHEDDVLSAKFKSIP